jgi:hypothetical protein
MKRRMQWPEIVILIGLVAMIVGATDPLEGSMAILPGSGMVALGAFFGRRERRGLIGCAFVMTALGIGAMWAFSAVGGFGGSTGRSLWWSVVLLPYPIGWVMGLVGAIGKGRHRTVLYWAFALMAIGIIALIGLNAIGQPGGSSRRSMFLVLAIAPYLAGVFLALITAVLASVPALRAGREEPEDSQSGGELETK